METAAPALHVNTVRAILKRAGITTVANDDSSAFRRSGVAIETEREYRGKAHYATGAIKVALRVNHYANTGTRRRAEADREKAIVALRAAGLNVTPTPFAHVLVTR